MSLEELLKKFLEKTEYDKNPQIKAIVAYGSRVRKTNKENSDLDILVITSQNKNYKSGMVIEGIKVDCNIYSVNDLFDIAYDKKLANNTYFESVLKSGKVLKDNGILGELEDYLQEISNTKSRKKKLSLDAVNEIKDMYDNFTNTKSSYWYYNLLEKLRMAYNYLKNCSYISMVKVYDIFSNRDFYQDAYSVSLPDESFVTLFLEAVNVDEYDTQLEIVHHILNLLGINVNREIDFLDDEESFFNDVDIKNELLVLYNKIEKVIELLDGNHPYATYTYNVLLRHLEVFYQRVYRRNNNEIDKAIKSAKANNNADRIKVLKELFGIVDKDYRFDYDNYMLKLKL